MKLNQKFGGYMKLSTATKIATDSAKESTEKHRIGCIIFDSKNYVSGCNRTFNNCKVENRHTPYSEHAEATCINHAIHSGIDIKNSTLVVVRVNRKGSLMLAKPCRSCTKLIESVGIKKIYYSNDPLSRSHINQNFKSL